MKKYKVIDIFTIISSCIVSITVLLLFDVINLQSEFFLTLILILPFVFITDIITMLIYKRFNPLKLAFYLRLFTILVLIMVYSQTEYFTSTNFSRESLFEMVGIIYVAVIANLIIFLFTKKDEIPKKVSNEVIIDINQPEETLLSINLNDLTITTLKALAKLKGIEGYTKLTKDEIIDTLK